MPRAVWLWLTALNLVFLAAPAALPWPVAATILTAYAASGPPVLAVAAAEGGFSRAAGLGRLLPWAPMRAWLARWIVTAEAAPAARGYAVLLVAVTAVYLTLDLNDLRRWIRGERGVPTPRTAAPAIP